MAVDSQAGGMVTLLADQVVIIWRSQRSFETGPKDWIPQVVIMNKEGAAMRFEKLGAQDKDLIMFTITGCFMSIKKYLEKDRMAGI